MGQVQPALAGEQEFAADRGHRVEQVDLGAAGGQHLGGHQAGRAAADHRHAQGSGGGQMGIRVCSHQAAQSMLRSKAGGTTTVFSPTPTALLLLIEASASALPAGLDAVGAGHQR